MVGINTNIAAYFSQNNLRTANDKTTNAIGRLSSGNRIVRSADDVAGLSIGTVLRTSVNTLRTALTNTFQANTLLNIADGGLANIGEILQRQKSLAVQSTSGTLSASERGFLNQEFQNLTQEIDRLVANTRFNDVVLLNGSLYDAANIQTDELTIGDNNTAIAAIGLLANSEFLGTVAELKDGVIQAEIDPLLDAITPAAAPTSGLNTSAIANNPAFVGDLSQSTGFEVTYVSATQLTIRLVVGNIEYRGVVDPTALAASQALTGYNLETGVAEGGTLGLNLAVSPGVANQDDADTYANRLNNVLSKVEFAQNRQLDVDMSGILAGGVAYMRDFGFEDNLVTDVQVRPADGVNTGLIDIVIDGAKFTYTIPATGNIDPPAPGDIMTFTEGGIATADRRIYFQWVLGSTATIGAITNTSNATKLEDALKVAFRVNTGDTRLTFQTGSKVDDKIDVQIRNSDTDSLYGGESLNILTVESAQAASTVIDNAINYLTSVRADVGALQSRFDYTANNLQTAIQNQDAARGSFLDADIEKESTEYATQQVKIQASISVLAQANQLPQNLLKLLG